MEAKRDGQRIGEISPGGVHHSVGKVEKFDGAVDDCKT